ncbi:MAG: response regulator transcription factor [bacterium]|nr:MAG: response regulator transcription factor [bacterium]
MVRQGFIRLLEERGIEVVGEAEDGRRGVDMALELKPDVVIMDISLPLLRGIEATKRIKRELPEIKVIILTVHSEENYLYEALKAGANGYLLKERTADELLDAIDTVINNETYLSPNFPQKLLQSYNKMVRSGRKQDEFSRLTKREREILQLIAEGYTSKEIAEDLFISRKTVENHRANIMNKLEIHDTAGLVRYAIKIGLIES